MCCVQNNVYTYMTYIITLYTTFIKYMLVLYCYISSYCYYILYYFGLLGDFHYLILLPIVRDFIFIVII